MANWSEGPALAREHRITYLEILIVRDIAIHSAADDPLRGLELFDTAIELFHEAGNVPQLIVTLGALCAFFEQTDRPETGATLYGATSHQPGVDLLVPNLSGVGQRLRLALGDSTFEQLITEHTGSRLSEATRSARTQIQVRASQLQASSDQAIADEAAP